MILRAPRSFLFPFSTLFRSLSVTQGGVAGVETVTAVLTSGQAQSVTFSISGLPSGVTASLFSPASCSPQLAGSLSPCSATVSLTATGSAVAGSTVVTISASPLGLTTKPATFTLTVVAPSTFDFGLSIPSPASLSVVQGSTSLSSSITATLSSGSATTVTFSVMGSLPSGVSASFTNNPCSPTCAVTVSFTATATATLGTSTVV